MVTSFRGILATSPVLRAFAVVACAGIAIVAAGGVYFMWLVAFVGTQLVAQVAPIGGVVPFVVGIAALGAVSAFLLLAAAAFALLGSAIALYFLVRRFDWKATTAGDWSIVLLFGPV